MTTLMNTLNQIDAYYFSHPMELGLLMISGFMVGQIIGFVRASNKGGV